MRTNQVIKCAPRVTPEAEPRVIAWVTLHPGRNRVQLNVAVSGQQVPTCIDQTRLVAHFVPEIGDIRVPLGRGDNYPDRGPKRLAG